MSLRPGFVVSRTLFTQTRNYYDNYGNPYDIYGENSSGAYFRIQPGAKAGNHIDPEDHAVLRQQSYCKKYYDDTKRHYVVHQYSGVYNPEYAWALDSPHYRFCDNVPDNPEIAGSYVHVDSPGIDIAVDKMYSQIARSDYSFGQELAELTQTVSYLTRSVGSAGQALLDIKRGNFSKFFRRAFQTQAKSQWEKGKPRMNRRRWRRLNADGRWLEAQFAVKPLLSSVDDAARLAATGLQYDPLLVYKGKYDQPNLSHKEFATGTVNGTLEYTGGYSVTHRVKTVFNIVDPALVALKNLGLINPVHVAWQLVPFSFVVDWILPVGKALSLFTALVGQAFRSGYKSVRMIGSHGYTVTQTNWNKSKTWFQEADIKFNGYSRKRIFSIPSWKPQVKSPFSWWHAATSGALIMKLTS